MNDRDRIACANLYPGLIAKLNVADAALAKLEISFCIVEGYRLGTQQDADFLKGRNAQGQVINRRQVVTNARAGQSMHQYGLAVDAVPYLVGDSGALNWNADSDQYRIFVQAMKDAGLAWGGDWKSIGDDDHFQFPGLPYTPTAAMQADYRAVLSLPAMWAKLEAGVYAPLPAPAEVSSGS